MADQVIVTVQGAFRHEHLAKGRHTFLLPLDPEVESLIGKVVVYWGALELRMDTLTEGVAEAMGERPLPPSWRRQPFKTRKKVFKSKLVTYAKLLFPAWVGPLAQLCDSAGDLHWRRNIVAHGYYELEPLQGGTHRFKASGEVKGERREMTIDAATLNKLWHDISHLLGDLMLFINHTGAKTTSLDLVIPDHDLLERDGDGKFRLLAVSDKIPPDPNPPGK